MSTIEKALQKQKANTEAKSAEPAAETSETQSTITKSAELANEKKQSTIGKSSTRVLDLKNIDSSHYVNGKDRNLLNDEFRVIKRKVLNNAFGPLAKTLNNSNIVMVTSPSPNEGKTFTAINLALSIAMEQDKTVLLVDADVLRPCVMKTIDQPFNDGLMEYLLGEVDELSKVIYPTTLDKLKVIPAGKSHHLSAELLASEKMLETVNEFATRYSDRVVIFDTPPLIGINETAILANLAGQGVIVVQEGKTPLNRVSDAIDQLSPDMAKGFVMNKVTDNSPDDASYYGYLYGSNT